MKSPAFRVALVLAAGRGERMQPLSNVVPKPALPLPEGPVIASALRLAAETGVQTVVVNTWHLAERMAAAVEEVDLPGVELAISPEDQLMGTAGGLALARDRGLLLEDGPVLVINGDGALGLRLDSLVTHHHRGDDLVTLALLPHLDPRRWSRVLLDAGGRVERILSPGPPAAEEAPFLYPGVMAVSRTALDDLPATPGEIPDLLWGPAREARRLGGVVVPGHWREVGTPAGYLEVVTQRLAGRTVVSPSARVDPGASLATSYIGQNAGVDAGAVVENSVVAEGAMVGRGTRVIRSVLLGAVKVRGGEAVVDEVRAEAR